MIDDPNNMKTGRLPPLPIERAGILRIHYSSCLAHYTILRQQQAICSACLLRWNTFSAALGLQEPPAPFIDDAIVLRLL